jgi:thiamine biosynthesis protein ThiS
MNVVVNGRETAIEDACSVGRLIEREGLGGAPCAVEVNRTLVPKRHYAQHCLKEGDAVEIVTLVGGG